MLFYPRNHADVWDSAATYDWKSEAGTCTGDANSCAKPITVTCEKTDGGVTTKVDETMCNAGQKPAESETCAVDKCGKKTILLVFLFILIAWWSDFLWF